jgi:hypothetical protein
MVMMGHNKIAVDHLCFFSAMMVVAQLRNYVSDSPGKTVGGRSLFSGIDQ